MKYVLDGHEPRESTDLMEWANWFENADNRVVAQTTIGETRVSTVFLGLDHDFSGKGPPILFETMVFGGAFDQDEARYHTWDEAERGHETMVTRVRQTTTQHNDGSAGDKIKAGQARARAAGITIGRPRSSLTLAAAQQAVEAAGGNKTHAAAALGVPRSSLNKRLKEAR